MIADDYFGPVFARRAAETDPAFRSRILAELVRERCTRPAMATALFDLAGSVHQIFEPARCADTGAYCGEWNVNGAVGGGLAYGWAGGWGSLRLPFTAFIVVNIPVGSGGAPLPGWDASTAGYGSGSTAYGSLLASQGQVTVDDVCQAVLRVLPTAVTVWLKVLY
jgi:hypothetical protein